MKVEKISPISSISKQRGVPDKGKESFRDALKRAATAKKDTFTFNIYDIYRL